MAYLEGVLVGQIQRIPRELGATTGVAAHQISILVACESKSAMKARAKSLKNHVRVISQIRSLETFVRSAAMVTGWKSDCEDRNHRLFCGKRMSRFPIQEKLAKRAALGMASWFFWPCLSGIKCVHPYVVLT